MMHDDGHSWKLYTETKSYCWVHWESVCSNSSSQVVPDRSTTCKICIHVYVMYICMYHGCRQYPIIIKTSSCRNMSSSLLRSCVWALLCFHPQRHLSGVNVDNCKSLTGLATTFVLWLWAIAYQSRDGLCDILYQSLLVDNADTRWEQRCSNETSNRQGDIFHPDFLEGKQMFLSGTLLQVSISAIGHHKWDLLHSQEKPKKMIDTIPWSPCGWRAFLPHDSRDVWNIYGLNTIWK